MADGREPSWSLSRRDFLKLSSITAAAAAAALLPFLEACASAPPDRHSFRHIPDNLTDPNARMYWERFEFRVDTTKGRITLNLTAAGRQAMSLGTQINGKWIQWEPNLRDLYNAASLHADSDGFSIDYDRFAAGLIGKYGTPDPKHPEKETILMQKEGVGYVLNPIATFAIFELPGDCFKKKESGELPESAVQDTKPPPAAAVDSAAAPATPPAKQEAAPADQPTTAPESSVLKSIGEAVDAIPLPVKVVGGAAAGLSGYAFFEGQKKRFRKARPPRPQGTKIAKHEPKDQAAPQTERDRRLAYLDRLRAKVLAPEKSTLSGFKDLDRMDADADERNRGDLVNAATEALNSGLINRQEAQTYLQDARYSLQPSTDSLRQPNAFSEGVQRVIDNAFSTLGEGMAEQVVREGIISAAEKAAEKQASGSDGPVVDSKFKPEGSPS